MKVLIDGLNTNGMLLGGLLALKGYEVAFVPGENPENRVTSIRISLPDRWLRVENLKHKFPDNPNILVIAPPPLQQRKGLGEILEALAGRLGDKTTILLLDKLQEGEEILHPALCCGLPLWQAAMLQPDHIELYSHHPYLVIEKNKLLKKIFSPLKSHSLKLKTVECLDPVYNSAFLYGLSFLPVALAGSTHEHFLSFPEGRKIITNLLQESMQIFEQHGRKLAPLPVMDPRKLFNQIQKKPAGYRIHRFQPARQINVIRQALILGQKPAYTYNHHLTTMAAEVGIEIFWNRRLVEFLEQSPPNRIFKSPVDLLKAIE